MPTAGSFVDDEREELRLQNRRAAFGEDGLNVQLHEDLSMKALLVALCVLPLLSACISSSSPPPPKTTTVVVPPSSGTTVICQDGSKPPCS